MPGKRKGPSAARRSMVAIVVGAMLMFGAGPAFASPPGTMSDPPSESQIAASGLSTQQVAAGSDCWAITVTAWAENAFGGTLYEYKVSTTYCYDGTNITSITPKPPTRTVYTNFGWSFVGHVDSGEGGGVGQSWYTYSTQGHFTCCYIWTGILNTYPCITIDLYGSGNWGSGGNAIGTGC